MKVVIAAAALLVDGVINASYCDESLAVGRVLFIDLSLGKRD